jgi:hypothetical protein
VDERLELGLTDYVRHEIMLKEPYRGKPVKVRIIIDHGKKSVKDAVAFPFFNGASGRRNSH